MKAYFKLSLLMIFVSFPGNVVAKCLGLVQNACQTMQQVQILNSKIDTITTITCDEVVTRGRSAECDIDVVMSTDDEKTEVKEISAVKGRELTAGACKVSSALVNKVEQGATSK